MKTTVHAHDFPQHPSVLEANARLIKLIYCIGLLGVVMPFLLPESPVLADSFLIQQLSQLIPSAEKLASAALFPNVAHVYIVVMLTLSFLLGIGHFLLLNCRLDYLKFSIAKNAPHGRWNLWCKALLGFFICAALLAFVYIFPGQPTGNPHGSRGQLVVSLMVMTKAGLATFGAIASIGATTAWFAWCLVTYNFFRIPFLGSSKSNKEQS